MSDERRFAADGVEEFFPYDGPHCPDRVADAARGLSALVRYLNNATGPSNDRVTLVWAATVHRVLCGVTTAVHGLDQLFDQLTAAMERQALDPSLYDDRRDRRGRDTAIDVAMHIYSTRPVARALAIELERAQQLAAHLGND